MLLVQAKKSLISSAARSTTPKEVTNMNNLWKIVMVSWGGIKRDFMTDLSSKSEAAEICEDYNWVFEPEEGGYVWDLEIEEM